MRNWSTKTEIPSETWWVFEQAIRILEQDYPLPEMLDFVNNISGQPKNTHPSPRQSLSVLPLLFQHPETELEWSQILTVPWEMLRIFNEQRVSAGIESMKGPT